MASKFPPESAVEQPETLLEFPCKFPIKAMGRDIDGFKELVESIIFEHADAYPDTPVTTNSSETGKFISVTVTIEATSKDQLDRIYYALTDCDQVVIAL